MQQIPCPFVYASGKKCTGHIVRVEAYKADITWEEGAEETWEFWAGEPRSHYHMFCSLKSNHAGYKQEDSSQMKCYYDQLPPELRQAMAGAQAPSAG